MVLQLYPQNPSMVLEGVPRGGVGQAGRLGVRMRAHYLMHRSVSL